MVTRPIGQTSPLVQQLNDLGARPIVFPCIEVTAVDCTDALAVLPVELDHIDLFIFVSSNAVQFAFAHVPYLRQAITLNKPFAAIGQATAQALHAFGVTQVIAPDQGFDSESLLSLAAMNNLQHKNVLIVKGAGGRTKLSDTLRARGAAVHSIDVYQRQIPAKVDLGALQPAPDVILFSSSESVENMLKIIPTLQHSSVLHSQTITGHARIAAKVKSLGFEKLPIIAANPSDEAMLTALKEWENRTENHNEQQGRNGT